MHQAHRWGVVAVLVCLLVAALTRRDPLPLRRLLSRSSRETENIAVALIACGEVAREALVPLCVRALRGAGRWEGKIYLLTDAPECAPESVDVVAVKHAPECREGSIAYKELKMRILEVAAMRGAEDFVLYIDVDVFAGRPLAPFVASAAREIVRNANTFVAYDEAKVTPDPFHADRLLREPYHGGVFFVARDRSEACLGAWRRNTHLEIEKQSTSKNAHVRDQQALAAAVAADECRVATFDVETLTKPNVSTIANKHYAVLNHVSRTGRLTLVRNRHHLTRDHLAAVAVDLVGLTPAEAQGSWWNRPGDCGRRPDPELPVLVLSCPSGEVPRPTTMGRGHIVRRQK